MERLGTPLEGKFPVLEPVGTCPLWLGTVLDGKGTEEKLGSLPAAGESAPAL